METASTTHKLTRVATDDAVICISNAQISSIADGVISITGFRKSLYTAERKEDPRSKIEKYALNALVDAKLKTKEFETRGINVVTVVQDVEFESAK